MTKFARTATALLSGAVMLATVVVAGSPAQAAYSEPVPTGLVSVSQASTSVSLDWNSVSGAQMYRVQLSTSSSMSGATYHWASSSDAMLDGLQPATKYFFRVAVINPSSGAKLSDYTQDPYPSTTTRAVAAGGFDFPIPTGLTARSASASSLTLDWGSVSGAPMYRVQYSTSPSMRGAKYAGFTSSLGTIPDLAPNTSYYVRVAVVEAGNGSKLSDYTQEPYAVGSTSAAVPGGYAYPVPEGLRTTSTSSSALGLTWNPISGAPEYRVQYSKSSSMSGAKYATFGGAGGTLTNLSADTTYYVRVAVVSTSGPKLSDYTQKPYLSARTSGPVSGGYQYPIPTDLVGDGVSTTTATLRWSEVTGAPRYRVQYSTSPSMSGAAYASFTSATGVLTGLSANTTYYVRVAVVTSGNGAKLSDYTQEPYTTIATASVSPPTGGSSDVAVGSFNVFGVNNDSKMSSDLKWASRKSAVVADILDENLAVVGLQEANQSEIYFPSSSDLTQYRDLVNALNAAGGHYAVTVDANYNCQRASSSNTCDYVDRGASNSTRVIYDTQQLTLNDVGSVKYNNQSSGKTDRYMSWAVFTQNSSGKSFFFSNTHLDPYSAAVRRGEWMEMIAAIDRLKGSRPVVSVGDFNSTKYNQPAGEMLAEMKAHGYGDVLNQEYRINPPRNPRTTKVINGYFNSFNDFVRDLGGDSKCYCGSQGKVGNDNDYVFATNTLAIKQWKLSLDVDSQFRLQGQIPSDHHMVSSVITLK